MIKIRKDFNQLKERSLEVDGLIEEPYGSVDLEKLSYFYDSFPELEVFYPN